MSWSISHTHANPNSHHHLEVMTGIHGLIYNHPSFPYPYPLTPLSPHSLIPSQRSYPHLHSCYTQMSTRKCWLACSIWLETPVHHCNTQGQLELIMLLLDAGTDVNSANHQSKGFQKLTYSKDVSVNSFAPKFCLYLDYHPNLAYT